MIYTNPQTHVEINDWPYGRYRTKATFSIETNKKGTQRAVRETINPKNGRVNKPKKTTYALKVIFVTGEDGKLYIAELTESGFISIMQSNLQYQQETIWLDDSRYSDIAKLFANEFTEGDTV